MGDVDDVDADIIVYVGVIPLDSDADVIPLDSGGGERSDSLDGALLCLETLEYSDVLNVDVPLKIDGVGSTHCVQFEYSDGVNSVLLDGVLLCVLTVSSYVLGPVPFGEGDAVAVLLGPVPFGEGDAVAVLPFAVDVVI